MPLFKSKKKAQAQAAEQEGSARHETRNAAGANNAVGAGGNAGPAANDYASQPGQAPIRTINRRGGRTTEEAQAGPRGYNTNAGTNGIGPSAPAAGHRQSRGADRAEGRVDESAGRLVGSRALQAQGAQKEQEANAIKAQSAELAEAERLEREAVLRRERAVAHGAHPANKDLGAGWAEIGSNNQTH